MRIRSSRWAAVVALCVAAVVTAVLVWALVKARHEPSATGSRQVTIPAAGGTTLSARLYVPSGRGPFPLVVMPASWGQQADEYAAIAAGFATSGYLVVAYAQRGIGGSTGTIDFAGTTTRNDVGTVIDWARAHTAANHGGVALVGASYGAGVGLLAAEHDSRIKAVAALSGWTDFAQFMAPGGTPSELAYQLLFATTHAQYSDDLRSLVDALAGGQAAAAAAAVRTLSPSRSPLDDVAALNRNKTAVFLSGTYQDSLVAPADLIDFYQALQGPKRLMLGVGDHAANLLDGLRGQPSTVWSAAVGWIRHYLGGSGAAPNPADAVQLTDTVTGATHDYRDWAATGSGSALRLGAATGEPATGSLTASADGDWTQSITAGVPTPADAGPEQATSTAPYQPPVTSLAAVPRTAGLVWGGTASTSATLISGQPRVHVDVHTDAGKASLFAYLYDVDPTGAARLVSYGTQTLTSSGLTAGVDADIALGPISWTVAAGHSIALVIDSTDARYLGQSVPGSTITLTSSVTDPATLTVPVG